MAANRIQRINEDMLRELSSLLRNIKDPRLGRGMVSVTAVDTSADLRYAHIFLSVYGLESEKEFMKGLKSASGYLRRELGHSLHLRYTPELVFELDKSIERGTRINSLLNDLNIPDDDGDEDARDIAESELIGDDSDESSDAVDDDESSDAGVDIESSDAGVDDDSNNADRNVGEE